MSERTVQTVPWFMANECGFDKEDIEESIINNALVHAFEKAHEDLVDMSAQKDAAFNVKYSGTTAVAAPWDSLGLFKGDFSFSHYIL